MSVVNWGERNYDSSGFEAYPTGTYRMRVLDVEETTSPNKGTPQLKFSMGIVEPEEYVDKKYTEYIPYALMWKIQQLCYAVGIDVKKLPNMDSDSPIFRKVVDSTKGREAWFYIEKTQYNNKDKNEIGNMQRIEGNDLLEIDVDAQDDVPDWVKE